MSKEGASEEKGQASVQKKKEMTTIHTDIFVKTPGEESTRPAFTTVAKEQSQTCRTDF
jgi:hypothetical protein